MADKETRLSIVLRTVDQATAKIKAVNDRLDAVTKPTRDFKKALGELHEKSGLDDVIGGFKGVTGAIGDLLGKVAMIGGVVGVALAGVFHLVGGFDDLGKKATRLGVGVDFLAEMRYAAEQTGVPIEALDESLLTFNQNLGQVRAGTGRMAKFLGLVSPVLLKQLKGAKDNAAAFDLLAGAMAKITDPAKRAALAQKTLGDSALAPLFMKGPAAIKAMREQYLGLAGSQEDATKAAEDVTGSMHELGATTDGVKAAIVEGLAPALKVIVEQLRDWFRDHRADVKEWAQNIGEKLPGAFRALVGVVRSAIDFIRPFVDEGWKLKLVLGAIAAVMTGPLVLAIGRFGIALLTTPFGMFLAGIAAVVAAVALAVKGIQKLAQAGRWIGEKAAYHKLVNQHMDEYRELNKEAIAAGEITEDQIRAQAERLAANDIATSHAREDADDKRAQAMIDGADNPSPADAYGAGAPDPMAALRKPTPLDAAGMLNTGKVSTEAKVVVDFKNAPPGTRVKTDPQSTADVDLSIGFQTMGFNL